MGGGAKNVSLYTWVHYKNYIGVLLECIRMSWKDMKKLAFERRNHGKPVVKILRVSEASAKFLVYFKVSNIFFTRRAQSSFYEHALQGFCKCMKK